MGDLSGSWSRSHGDLILFLITTARVGQRRKAMCVNGWDPLYYYHGVRIVKEFIRTIELLSSIKSRKGAGLYVPLWELQKRWMGQ
jgi:hypothetical protein